MADRVHIVGRKNSGKTTLVCQLVEEFSRQGLRVATVKHTHHAHELDTPGKDSHQHREAGAVAVGIVSPHMTAAFVPVVRSESEDCYASLTSLFADADLVLVEGDLQTTEPKVEVWRQAATEVPYAVGDPSITAVITDDEVSCACDIWPRSDIVALAASILKLAQASDP